MATIQEPLLTLFRKVCVLVSAGFVAGCSGDVPLPTAVTTPAVEAAFLEVSTSPIPLTPLVELTIPTFDKSGQVVHPDVVHFPAGWHGWEYWMAMTPFPGGNEAFENPSIVVSHDGLSWQVPAGLTNPLARTPGKGGYNSDPDLSYDLANNRLVLLYREVSTSENLISTVTSLDGVHWSKPALAFRRPNHSMVSPTVTFGPSGNPTLWYVDAGPKKCAERTTHVMMEQGSSPAALRPAAPDKGWTAPKMNLIQPRKNIWHMDVTWVPERSEYWATYVAYPGHDCFGQDLYFARSSDGVKWTTYSIPFLRHGESSWTGNTLYRASVLYDASRNAIQFFVSAAATDKTWHVGYVDYNLSSFLASLENGFPVLVPATSRAPDTGPVIEP